ncbi:hypothetical protein RB195_004034 [Necator americanus]|uniref:Reverse transcriptase domain-containing protein n=1 Tax=Necator americanus TaxID=51031 RepID=A0ABR1BJU7_NECAM
MGEASLHVISMVLKRIFLDGLINLGKEQRANWLPSCNSNTSRMYKTVRSGPSWCPLTDLEYADDVVILTESSAKLQHVVNLVSKLPAAYGLRLRPDECKQMWISLRSRTEIRVDGVPIEVANEFCQVGCMLKSNGGYAKDIRQKCAKATSALNSLTKSVVDPYHQR